MSSVNPGIQPGTGPSQGVPGSAPAGPEGKVSGDDAQAFDSAMEKGTDGKVKKEGDQEELLTPEEQLRKMMSQQVVQQISERSKEFSQEVKKNFEG
ncbi:hypothetical protein [Sansalvadorimonas verongulae]|uniref:hypothetical protein n=1 Tax=Sansalvadorimonas verongulae TaxID=2172824 RepID=UPI0012BB532C|nr:hypothetical protein [Sansalvadorimonas verongulae]MTI12886.1 hypothetical protein [Sansalvadorimonas verongulae]